MNPYIVMEPYEYTIECSCPNPEHTLTFELHRGDKLIITEDKKFVESMGWYQKVIINDEQGIYMNCLDIEEVYQKGKICSMMDVGLDINYVTYKVNEALDQKDVAAFQYFTNKLNKIKQSVELTHQ